MSLADFDYNVVTLANTAQSGTSGAFVELADNQKYAIPTGLLNKVVRFIGEDARGITQAQIEGLEQLSVEYVDQIHANGSASLGGNQIVYRGRVSSGIGHVNSAIPNANAANLDHDYHMSGNSIDAERADLLRTVRFFIAKNWDRLNWIEELVGAGDVPEGREAVVDRLRAIAVAILFQTFTNGLIDTTKFSNYRFDATAFTAAEMVAATLARVQAVIRELPFALQLLCASAINYWTTNHCLGGTTGAIGGALAKVINADSHFAGVMTNENRRAFANVFHKLLHSASARNTIVALKTGVDASVITRRVVGENISGLPPIRAIAADEIISLRSSSSPAGTQKIALAYKGIRTMASIGIGQLANAPGCEEAVVRLFFRAIELGALAHVSYYYWVPNITDADRVRALEFRQDSGRDSEMVTDTLGRYGMFLATCQSSSTLNKSPILAAIKQNFADPEWRRVVITYRSVTSADTTDDQMNEVLRVATSGIGGTALAGVGEFAADVRTRLLSIKAGLDREKSNQLALAVEYLDMTEAALITRLRNDMDAHMGGVIPHACVATVNGWRDEYVRVVGRKDAANYDFEPLRLAQNQIEAAPEVE